MTISNVPSVLAFDRKLEPSDALMFSGCWCDTGDDKKWAPIKLFERRNRAVKSNFSQEVLNDEEELQKQITEANLSWGDDAALHHNHDTLKVSFSLRVIAGLAKPSVCNDTNFEARYREKISAYVETGLGELANRYAYNIANGRFLWRNRVGALGAKIIVSHSSLDKPLVFNAYDFSLHQTTSDNPELETLANLIHQGLGGAENILLKINAFVQLGDQQRVWPSQEMVLNSPKGSKSRHLFNLNGQAAMHCEKIGNALRTIDDWYPNATSPIAVEAYGTVTQRGVAYRSSRNDFKTLLLAWLNEADDSVQLVTDNKHFVAAMLIRGGVFGESAGDGDADN
ncbi:type I-F CRISPR-associated protein Csy3 [Shewanella sp. SNU WT4]|uniref:type I-F CRISPR-associated protein Csy3 n=1 Tax=Shewanella sp. SNU WT4 TaxID=2590015 RepID=UPI00112D8953|nr:type I-F CRISPR-associated protein Csy3 [Shewanella sp. SNU WT4]QDF67374.1 type I-F CRISPR-associated protein Csy3 [Shewanella sp. SNU WT4]